MATATVSAVNAINTAGFQDLSTVEYTDSWREGVDGVPFYQSLGSTVPVSFAGDITTVGADVNFANSTEFSLNTGLVFSLTATVESNSPGITFQWYDTTNQAYVGVPFQSGVTTTTLIDLSEAIDSPTFVLNAISKTGTQFEYPQQITFATATVEVVSGFTVA